MPPFSPAAVISKFPLDLKKKAKEMKRKQAAVLLQQLKAGEGRLTKREAFYFAFLLDAGKLLVTAIGS